MMNKTPFSTLRIAAQAAIVAFAAGAARSQPAAPPAAAPGQQVPPGQILFQQFCIVCHGPMLQGSPLGPSLTTQEILSKSDRDLTKRIAEGSQQFGMPAFGRGLSKDEIASLVDYLHVVQKRITERRGAQMAKPSPIAVGGDARKGEELFKGKARCIECHSVYYTGGTVGPDLTTISERLSPGEIYEAIKEPSKKVAREFQAKTITTPGGKSVTGRFRNETQTTIQIADPTGALWTTHFRAEGTKVETSKKSLMPEGLLDALSEDEAKNLFAYFAELK
ncbi:c-type cytochrome [Candidatus Sumerlaeota bacterium]|nr:c-type cytochrome [Candidatus Sumerlaeota bacterium]